MSMVFFRNLSCQLGADQREAATWSNSFFLSEKVLVHFNDSALTDSADPPCFHPHFVWSVCSVPVGVLDLRNGCCYLERGLSVEST